MKEEDEEEEAISTMTTTPTTALTAETTIHTNAHAFTHTHLHTHTLREVFALLRGHSMPYEPVLAPTGVTSDSTSSVSGDSGFRHYLRQVSSPGTPARVISTAFIIPQNEIVNDQVSSKNYHSVDVQEWKHTRWREHTSVDRTSLIDPFSPTTMATATLATSTMLTNTESGFQDGGLSSSTISSSIESPRSMSLRHVEEEAETEADAETVASNFGHSATYQPKSRIWSWLHKFSGRKASEAAKAPDNPLHLSRLRLSMVVSQHEPRPKHLSTLRVEKRLEQNVIHLRSIEVSASVPFDTTTKPTVHWTEYVTKVGKPTSAETVLHTTCLQTTCGDTSHIASPPPEVSNPPTLLRVGRVETALLPTMSQSWAKSDFSSRQLTSVVSVFSDPRPPTQRYISWENKSTSPFTFPPTFGEESVNEVKKSPLARDRSYWYRDDPDSTFLLSQVYLDSDTSYFRQSGDSTPVESESLYEPVCKKTPCRESQNENPPRSSQSTPVCIATCHSFIAGPSSKSSINDGDSSKVDGKLNVTPNQLNLQNGRSSWGNDESKLNGLPGVKNLVTKMVVQMPLSSTPEHQQYNDEDGVNGKTVEKRSPIVPQRITATKPASVLDRSMMKLPLKTPPPVVYRRNRDIANGVQSPLSPYPVGSKTWRNSSLSELAISPRTNNREDGKFTQPVDSACPLNSDESYQRSQVNSECRKKSLADRLSPLRDVDTVGNSTSNTGSFEESIKLKEVSLVNAPKENIIGNGVNMHPETTNKVHTTSNAVESRPNIQDSQKRDKNLNSFTATVAPAPRRISNEPSSNINQEKCISITSVSKPVAKVLPSTISQGEWHFVEGGKSQATLLAKSRISHANSKAKEAKRVQPQGQVAIKVADGEISTSIKENGLPKAAEEVLPMRKTSSSKNDQLLLEVEKEIEIFTSNSTHSSVISISTVSEKSSIQIVPPTIQEIQIPTVEAQRKPSLNSLESTLQVALQNESARVTHSKASSSSYHSEVIASIPLQIIKKPQESLDKTPVSRDSLTAFTPPSRPLTLQSSDLDKAPAAGKRNQVTPTSPTGQHFFPKSHQLPQSTSGTTVANHEKRVEEELKGMEEGTLNDSETATANMSSPPPIKSTKIARSMPVSKRPQTARIFRTQENEEDFFTVPAETHKDIKPEDHFLIYEDIGKGKFGKVVRCENKQTHKIMAMKEIKTDRLPRHFSGDVMEVAVLRVIGRHNNIACFFSAYEVQHACFIVTEYVCGGALYDRVVAEDNLDEKISASIIRQMLLGLEHIQTCSVLHLDLKPENVMMVAPSGYQLKIIDFGLAYFYDPQRPRRQIGGTYIYSAPETITYDYQSFATDIWSVGVIAYELLSGITPFECPQSGDPERELTLSEITTNIMNCRYNFDDDGICDASDEAKDFICTILKKSPKDRPSVEACLKHSWMEMSNELPTVRRDVSIRRRASAKEKTRPFEISHLRIATDDAVY